MKNLNKFSLSIATFFYLFLSSQQVLSSEVIESLGGALILSKSNQKLYGYYNAVVPNFSCTFFIYGEDANQKTITITTFDTNRSYNERVKNFDIPGFAIELESDKWQIKTQDEQAGCGGAVGSFTWDDDRATTFFMRKKYPAIGIRIVKSKAIIYQRINGKFIAKKSYLVAPEVIVFVKKDEKFAFIRYFDKLKKSNAFGWVFLRNLENPFPDAERP